jgi:toxin ParE1/3/4
MVARSRRLDVGPQARQALEDIYRYSARHRGRSRADSYVSGLIAVFDRIATGSVAARQIVPLRGSVVVQRTRYGQHYVYWTESEELVEVIAILHTAMLKDVHLARTGWSEQ